MAFTFDLGGVRVISLDPLPPQKCPYDGCNGEVVSVPGEAKLAFCQIGEHPCYLGFDGADDVAFLVARYNSTGPTIYSDTQTAVVSLPTAQTVYYYVSNAALDFSL